MLECGSISRRLSAAVFAVLTLFGHRLFAQSADLAPGANDIPVLQVSASLVVVDAVVTDGHTHRPIRGLTPDDFVLIEEGREQTILNSDHDRIPLSIVFMIDLTRTVNSVRQSLGAAAQKILDRLDENDEVAVVAVSSSATIVSPFTTDWTKAQSAIVQASQMSSNEPMFLNESLYQTISRLIPSATAGNRRTIVCLTDGTVDVPSARLQTAAPGIAKAPLHTEEETKALVLQANATINAVVEKSALTYLVETSRHPRVKDTRRYPPGNVKEYAGISGGIVISSSKSNGSEALLDLLDKLKLRYTIAYRPSEAASAGSFRHISLRISPEAMSRLGPTSVQTREGYFR